MERKEGILLLNKMFLSSIWFNILLLWVIRNFCTEQRGIQKDLFSPLEELDYADDLDQTVMTMICRSL